MAYEPTAWKSGDVVTSAKLNKIEQGIANASSGLLIVKASEDGDTLTLDKTWQEIHDADFAVVVFDSDGSLFGFVQSSAEPFGISEYVTNILFIDDTNAFSVLHFGANSADGYPSYTWE